MWIVVGECVLDGWMIKGQQWLNSSHAFKWAGWSHRSACVRWLCACATACLRGCWARRCTAHVVCPHAGPVNLALHLLQWLPHFLTPLMPFNRLIVNVSGSSVCVCVCVCVSVRACCCCRGQTAVRCVWTGKEHRGPVHPLGCETQQLLHLSRAPWRALSPAHPTSIPFGIWFCSLLCFALRVRFRVCIRSLSICRIPLVFGSLFSVKSALWAVHRYAWYSRVDNSYTFRITHTRTLAHTHAHIHTHTQKHTRIMGGEAL